MTDCDIMQPIQQTVPQLVRGLFALPSPAYPVGSHVVGECVSQGRGVVRARSRRDPRTRRCRRCSGHTSQIRRSTEAVSPRWCRLSRWGQLRITRSSCVLHRWLLRSHPSSGSATQGRNCGSGHNLPSARSLRILNGLPSSERSGMLPTTTINGPRTFCEPGGNPCED
jgi:hypothetical protein